MLGNIFKFFFFINQSKPPLAELEQSGFRRCGNSQAWKSERPWQDSGVLEHSPVKAAEVNRGRGAHGDHISELEEKGRMFSNSCCDIKGKYTEKAKALWEKFKSPHLLP